MYRMVFSRVLVSCSSILERWVKTTSTLSLLCWRTLWWTETWFTGKYSFLIGLLNTHLWLVDRQTACAAIKHMALGVFGFGCEDALVHLMNYVWPNVFETSPHLVQVMLLSHWSIQTTLTSDWFRHSWTLWRVWEWVWDLSRFSSMFSRVCIIQPGKYKSLKTKTMLTSDWCLQEGERCLLEGLQHSLHWRTRCSGGRVPEDSQRCQELVRTLWAGLCFVNLIIISCIK